MLIVEKVARFFYDAIIGVFGFFCVPWNDGIISDEAIEILSHPEDAKKYEEAIERIKHGAEEASFTTHKGKVITLIR